MTMSRTRTLFRRLPRLLACGSGFGAFVLASLMAMTVSTSAEAQVDTYRVLMKNGNTFRSGQRPVTAWFDENKVLLLSEGGHMIALERDEIERVESDLEFEGYGTLLNKTTILVGNVANDAPVPDPDAAMNQGNLPPNLASLLINQPFLAGTAPQAVGSPTLGGATAPASPFGSGAASALEAPVFNLPN